ncbi:MAG TPA: ABC transporter permease [Anaerolineae bacterium]|nr:ABC transporter permease [Anaerolineae bacterium]
MTEGKETAQPGPRSRLDRLPRWVRLGLLLVFLGLVIALKKWLILALLLMLGLWPLTLLAALVVLVLVAVAKGGSGPSGGWAWLKTWLAARLRALAVPALAVLTALVIGGIVLMLTDQEVLQALGDGQIGDAVRLAFANLARAYGALYEGALGNPRGILEAVRESAGSEDGLRPLLRALRGPSDTIVQSVPYIFAGLAVALGFRAGLFNIGAEGQIGIGWLAAVVVGFSFTNLPAYIHLPLAIAAGAVAGGLWAGIAGVLKARTGAHEVITTIMLNYIVYRLSAWLLCGPLEFTQGTCRTQDIAESAFLPRFLDHPVTIHWGFVLALVAAVAVGWFLFRTRWGFELRTVGANPSAARYGGMSVGRTYVLAMFLSGALAGLSGTSQGLGITHNIALGFQAGYGFDSIALALLGKSHPLGVVLASFLFGMLRAGAARMQSVAGVPTEIVQIVQALVIIFIAAPAIIRALYRFRAPSDVDVEATVFTRGWGA